jgi:hypothetical protein
MLLMAAVVLAQETAPAVGIAMAAGTVVAAVTYLTCRRTTHCPLRSVTGRARAIARGNRPNSVLNVTSAQVARTAEASLSN